MTSCVRHPLEEGQGGSLVLDVDVLSGCVVLDGKVVWQAEASDVHTFEARPVRCLDQSARLVMDASGARATVLVLFDEEEFPDSILTARMVKGFIKKAGVQPEMVGRSQALARFPWGEIEFSVDPKQGDLSIAVRGC